MSGMELSLAQIIAAAVAVCFGAVVQGAVGFAYGLFTIPVLLWLRVPLAQAAAMVATASLIQTTIAVAKLRHHVPWRAALSAGALRTATTVPGVMLLRHLAEASLGEIRLVVGCIVVGAVTMECLGRGKVRTSLHPAWGVAAFSASGLLFGSCAIGGPPLVLWAMAHPWSNRTTRAFLYAVFMTTIPVGLALWFAVRGQPVLWGALAGALMFPVVMLGSAVGLRIGDRWSKPLLRRIVYGLLIVIAVSAIVPKLSEWLGR